LRALFDAAANQHMRPAGIIRHKPHNRRGGAKKLAAGGKSARFQL
jgi:hypothetical protein